MLRKTVGVLINDFVCLLCVCACVSANVSEKIRRMIWRGREKEMCIYADVFLPLSLSIVMSYSTHGWLSDRQWAGFAYLIRFKDRWEWNDGGRETVCLSFRINIHVKRSEVVHSFIHFNPHSNEMCPSFLISTHRHSLIFQQEHTLSLPAHSFAVHPMMMAIEREK